MSVVVVVVLNFFPTRGPSCQKPSSEDHLKQKSRFPTAGKLFVRC
jgi:hypothetical protein